MMNETISIVADDDEEEERVISVWLSVTVRRGQQWQFEDNISPKLEGLLLLYALHFTLYTN